MKAFILDIETNRGDMLGFQRESCQCSVASLSHTCPFEDNKGMRRCGLLVASPSGQIWSPVTDPAADHSEVFTLTSVLLQSLTFHTCSSRTET